MEPISYARHQFPPAVIQQAIRLYLRFTLSHRDVEELLAERGLEVSHGLWHAVDDEGEVLDVLVQRRRDKAAAKRPMRKLLKRQGFAPARLTTDKLPSYGAAFDEMGLAARHERGRRQNNRAEVSHRPVRRRERKMQRFKPAGSAQASSPSTPPHATRSTCSATWSPAEPTAPSGPRPWRNGRRRRPRHEVRSESRAFALARFP